MAAATRPLYAGLMSGTSADGVDAVAAHFPRGGCEIRAAVSVGYPATLRSALLACSVSMKPLTLGDYAELDAAVGDAFADAAQALLDRLGDDRRNLVAIGSHGQTIFHLPRRNSLQLGDPNRVAAATAKTIVADFRRADMAAGGQGAPLAPAFHHAVFARGGQVRGILNLGGIANVSILNGRSTRVVGFDTGPANGLLDEWMLARCGRAFDAEGAFARSGQSHAPLLEALLAEPYFALAPPKSTGRDYFNLAWCRGRYPALDRLDAAKVAATLTELSAYTVAAAIQRSATKVDGLWVCGGGARNPYLLERIAAHLPGVPIATTAEVGVAPQWVEAAAFAWLAKRRLQNLPANLPSVTGAARRVVLGAVYRA